MKPVLETSTISVTLPEMGESVTEGSIVEWRRKPGEFVAEGDPLVEVTTDKVDVEVPATASGVLTQILAHEGDTVAVGAVLAEIDTSKKDGAGAAPPSAGNGAAKTAALKPQAPTPAHRRGAASPSPTIRPNARRSGSTSILPECAARGPMDSFCAPTCWRPARPRAAARPARLRNPLRRFRLERR